MPGHGRPPAAQGNRAKNHTGTNRHMGSPLRDAAFRLPNATRAGTWAALSFHQQEDGTVSPLAHLSASLPVCTSHSLIVWSKLPEASVLPSVLYARDHTK